MCQGKANPNVEFKDTEAYLKIKKFIFEIDNSIKTEKQESKEDVLLSAISKVIDETPLSPAVGRYANPAMVNVIEKIESLSGDSYLKNSFGNKIRMDFGTGHELNFLCYLYGQYKAGKIPLNSILSVIAEYFRIVRRFIKKFNVEAAGSRGCWSIDDYLLFPYVFGSAENFDQILPMELLPKGVFKEAQMHNKSQMLANICKLPWKTMNIGMMKMYDEEVLGKKVVTQHFIYSEILPETIIKGD